MIRDKIILATMALAVVGTGAQAHWWDKLDPNKNGTTKAFKAVSKDTSQFFKHEIGDAFDSTADDIHDKFSGPIVDGLKPIGKGIEKGFVKLGDWVASIETKAQDGAVRGANQTAKDAKPVVDKVGKEVTNGFVKLGEKVGEGFNTSVHNTADKVTGTSSDDSTSTWNRKP